MTSLLTVFDTMLQSPAFILKNFEQIHNCS